MLFSEKKQRILRLEAGLLVDDALGLLEDPERNHERGVREVGGLGFPRPREAVDIRDVPAAQNLIGQLL